MAQNVVINGVTYQNVPEVNIPKSGGGTAAFYDPADATAGQGDILTGKTDATAGQGDILTGKTAYISGGKKSGSMVNNGATGGSISTKAGTVAIPAGYTSGGSVGIASAQQDLIVSGNIKSGVTILGVSGSSNVVDTTLASGAATSSQIVSGYSAFVNGTKVDGVASMPVISQDSTTKVLSIS